MNKESRNRYLIKNTVLFTIGSFGTRFISFFLVPLYTGVFSTEEFGTVDLVSTVCAILVPLLSMNIGEAVMRFSLDEDANQEKIMKIGWFFMLLCLIMGILSMPVIGLFDSLEQYVFPIGIYSITMGWSQIAICELRGKELLLDYSIANIINSAIAAILNIIFLIFLELGVLGYFQAYIIANIITIMYALFKSNAFKTLNCEIDKSLMRRMLEYSFFLIPTTFMWWITNSSDRIMVTAFLGVSENGIYAIAYKIPTLISSLTSVFNQAWSYSAIREKSSSDENEYANDMYNKMFSMMALVSAGMLFIIKPFLRIYVEKSYYEAWKYVPFLIIGSLFMTLATFLSTSYTVHKDSKGFLVSGALGAIVNIVLNFLLIPLTGVYGAAIATCVSYIAVYVFRCIHTRKYIVIQPLNGKHIKSIVLLVFMSITLYIKSGFELIILGIEMLFIFGIYRHFIIELLSLIKNFLIKRKD